MIPNIRIILVSHYTDTKHDTYLQNTCDSSRQHFPKNKCIGTCASNSDFHRTITFFTGNIGSGHLPIKYDDKIHRKNHDIGIEIITTTIFS